ncbi:ATPase Cu transporting protein 7B [Chytriomyces hyalinus]|nr:ATPase Cu transporting protein 7B [Chytriomyces hyalinus]
MQDTDTDTTTAVNQNTYLNFKTSKVCECSKCTCTTCTCNTYPTHSRSNSVPRHADHSVLHLRVALASTSSALVLAPTSSSSASSSATSTATTASTPLPPIPACVANPHLRISCPSRVRCVYVHVKYALLRDASIRSVVFVDDHFDRTHSKDVKNQDSIDIHALLATDADPFQVLENCKSILTPFGYSVSLLDPIQHPAPATPSRHRKHSHATIIDMPPNTAAVTVGIIGMTCKSCSKAITKGLASIPGIIADSINVSLVARDRRILQSGATSPKFPAVSQPSTSSSSRVQPKQKIGEANFVLDLIAFSKSFPATSDISSFVKERIESFGFEVAVAFVDESNSRPTLEEAGPSNSTLSSPFDQSGSLHAQPPVLSQSEFMKADIVLSGLTCSTCIQSVESALRHLPGISSVQVFLLPYQRAIILHNPRIISVAKIVKAIQDVGFDVLNHASLPATSGFDSPNIRRSQLSSANGLESFSSPSLTTLTHVRSPFIERAHMAATPSQSNSNVAAPAEQQQIQESSTTTKLEVGGMTCASCVASVERVVAELKGVESVSVSLLTNMAVIKHAPSTIGVRSLITAITDAGFSASLSLSSDIQNVAHERSLKELADYQKSATIAFIFALPAFIVSMIIGMALPEDNPVRQAVDYEIVPGLTVRALVMVCLATPVQFWVGGRFYRGAWKSLRYAKSANMDVLVALGTSAAYFYSLYAVIASTVSGQMAGHEYFETSVLLIFFILLGKYLESYAKGKTGEAVTKLIGLTPDTVTVVYLDHAAGGLNGSEDFKVLREEVVNIGLIEVGDIIRVPVGSRFPCDAILVSGTTHADESMLTGEPIPSLKIKGDPLTGGTLNATSSVLIKAVHIGSDTVLSRIVACVQDAQMSKAPIQAVADRVSRVFVPAVVAISCITFIVWFVLGVVYGSAVVPEGSSAFGFALNFAIAVLVIACPCALGLATPTAVMVGTGVAAQHGILVKGGGAALQMASEIKTIIFDKTGTLTLGKPTVTDAFIHTPKNEQPSNPSRPLLNSSDEIYSLIAYAESSSTHPLAVAATAYATARTGTLPRGTIGPNWTAGEVREVAGMGLSIDILYTGTDASLQSRTFLAVIGSRRWVEATNHCTFPSEEYNACIQEWERDGKTSVYAGLFETGAGVGSILGVLAISDPPRVTSFATVAALRGMGVRVLMMTGDQRTTAEAVAKLVGIEAQDVIAGCLPADKGNRVKLVKQELVSHGGSGKVAFAGDGINDSIALANADVGIALGGGSDIAIESASAVLLRSELSDIVTLVKLSRTVLNRIYLNMGGAFLYNVIGIPVAAGAFYFAGNGFMLAPWIAGLAMALSSVTVVVSSLALKLFRA